MVTVWVDPSGERREPGQADAVVRGLDELLESWRGVRG
jgi:hypothetical protein